MAMNIKDYLEQGPASSKEIQATTGLSQTAVARQLRNLGDRVITLKEGRSRRYALATNAYGADDKLLLVMVDPYGNWVPVADIRPLAHGGFYVDGRAGMPQVLLGEKGDGLYDDLPYFLYDLAPQGFLGRQIAKHMASRSGEFPEDPKHWQSNHIGRYLISNGDDLPGNFKFGPQAIYRVTRKPTPVGENDYPALADAVMSGSIPGSSAGGEQPKFTAFSAERSAHVIVKFSPKEKNELSRRWRDILITEFHATEVLNETGFPAAQTRLIEKQGRLFLESIRFDRSGQDGRLSMISLQAVDAEFTGLGSNWPNVMVGLHQKGLVNDTHVIDAEGLWHFGRLINNTDMHLGNLSLAIDGHVFRLLPAYDMCSMGFAPKSGDEAGQYNFIAPDIKPVITNKKTVDNIKQVAREFWFRVANDDRISEELRRFLAQGNPIDLLENNQP